MPHVRVRATAVISCLLLWPGALSGQVPPVAELAAGNDYEAAIEEARSRVRAVMAEAGIPGASVAVDVGGEVVWSEGFGWADLEQRVPVTPLSRFRVGSVSKTMTATGLGLLLEEGLVDLDAPVQDYVPDFPEKRWTVTTRQLGGHTAGVRHYRGSEMLSDVYYESVDDGLEIFRSDTLLFEPGTDYAYSSYGWNLLSAVIESASGEPFLEFMRDRVFEPLGLRHTVPDQNTAIVPDRVSFYEKNEDGELVNAPHVDNSYKWAGGGFLSTPEDLVKFGRAHMGAGFLEAETLETLQTSQRLRGRRGDPVRDRVASRYTARRRPDDRTLGGIGRRHHLADSRTGARHGGGRCGQHLRPGRGDCRPRCGCVRGAPGESVAGRPATASSGRRLSFVI